MQRFPRTATIVIAALTALAWLLSVCSASRKQAALALGFIPARLSGVTRAVAGRSGDPDAAEATLVHSGLVHLGFNLLMLRVVRDAVERCSGAPGWSSLYIVGAYAAAARAMGASIPSATCR